MSDEKKFAWVPWVIFAGILIVTPFSLFVAVNIALLYFFSIFIY
jgi:hypothetical protein